MVRRFENLDTAYKSTFVKLSVNMLIKTALLCRRMLLLGSHSLIFSVILFPHKVMLFIPSVTVQM